MLYIRHLKGLIVYFIESRSPSRYKWNFLHLASTLMSHSTLLQAEEKRAHNPVPKYPSKLLEPAIGRLAGWSSSQGHFGTELRARFFCRMEYRWPWLIQISHIFGIQSPMYNVHAVIGEMLKFFAGLFHQT